MKRKIPVSVEVGIATLLILASCIDCKLFPIEPRNSFQDGTSKWPAGSVWPQPRFHHATQDLVSFDPYTFRIVPMSMERCEPLEFAIVKYSRHFLFPDMFKSPTPPDPEYPTVSRVYIELSGAHNECLSYPQLSENAEHEQYILTVDSTANGVAEIKIRAETIWGALRGIETFSQLIWSNTETTNGSLGVQAKLIKRHYYMNSTTVYDWPRFPHRGLMIDSARHYLPERIFYQILDGMMYNKLNVLHWHITDDQSFPYVSQKYPQLSEKGAYNPKAIYTPAMVKRIQEAARLRGIRVVLEFDTPGHTHAFGKGFPELLTPCYGDGVTPGTSDHPYHSSYENLNPTREFTYDFMKDFFSEIAVNVTKDVYIHVGLDEIYMACWQSSPEIKSFMSKNNFTRLNQVQEYYTHRHIEMVKSLGLKPIAWQDPLDYQVKLDKDVVIQVWKDWGLSWQEHFQAVLDKGYKTILSSPWYLNYITYGETWKTYYRSDPITSLPDITEEQEKLILGGEACIWGEYVDKTNILTRIFPFVGAIAERLWSSHLAIDANTADEARSRLDQMRCRLLRRGIPAQPILNGYCGEWETENEYLARNPSSPQIIPSN